VGRLSGKQALVTAAGQGIGRASVLAMAREGAEVWATDVNDAALAALDAEWARAGTGAEGSIRTRRLDVLDPASIGAAVTELGAPHVLFNCAGYVAHGTILDCDEDQWDFSVRLNMTAMYRMCRAFLPGMIANGGASIVNMASVASTVIAAPNRFVYGATKAGVIGLTKAIAADFIGQGIRCNAICPGTIETPSMLDRAAAAGPNGREMFVSRQPMGRLGTAEEIAALAVYLASDESAFTTGVAHIIDGGWTL
jgi:2-keto-3-deoxy-L-fuconate dehydrogenase